MNATEIIKRLTANGSEAYVIGGAVRDKLMGLPAKDEDVVTKARPSEIIKLFRDRKVSEVGKSFGVVLIDGIEVATYRKDRYEGLSDKKVEITYADTLYEDVVRRDFTINTIAWNPITNEIIDHLNGRADIYEKKICFVNNPDERIMEDPNRIMRAIRFAARFNFSIDGESWAALKKHGNYVKEYVAKERIQKEILEAMKIKHASLFFRLLHDLDILKNILPSMEACYGHPHGKYHREDIFDHLMISGDHISTKYPILKLATYLHDIGKPAVYEDDHFIDHEVVGANLVSQQLGNLGFSKDIIHYISSVTRLHMRSHLKTPTPKSVRRFLFKLEESGIPFIDMVRLCNADLAGSDRTAGGEDEDRYEKLYNLIKMIHTELDRPAPVHSLHNLALNGNDVMKITGIPAGPEIGRLLNKLHKAVIENPDLNNVPDLTEFLKTGACKGIITKKRIDWMQAGKHHWENKQESLEKIINKMEWIEIVPGLTLPFMQGAAIDTIIKGFKIPQVTHVCHVPDLAPYGLVGVRAHYENEDVDFFAVDEGVQMVSLCAVVTEKEVQASGQLK